MKLYEIYNGYIYIYISEVLRLKSCCYFLVLRDIHWDQDGENGGPYLFFVVFDG